MTEKNSHSEELELKVEQRTQELQQTLAELKHTQSYLVQSEKLATIGQLTAGVAHELNNPINFISTGAVGLKRDMEDIIELLDKYEQLDNGGDQQKILKDIAGFKEKIDLDALKESIEQTLEDIKMGASRTTEIVKGLRSFSRLDSENQVYSNIHVGLDDTITILNTRLKHKVEVIKNYDKNMKEIQCYPGQLNQVFMNLIVNAEQAIIDRGTITLTTKNLGDKISICIKDNGEGMSAEVQRHIFDPFYTTKEVGEGTGLGMSISYGIIEKHNGTINVKSRIGKGSLFTITIPIKGGKK
jgi:signal transduction histidine kinase